MPRLSCLAVILGVAVLFGCESLKRFDTKGPGAYCGTIVNGQFVRTTLSEGGFDRNMGLRLEVNTDALTTTPGNLTSNDAAKGPCAPEPTFDTAHLEVSQELVRDPLSTMTFEDGQVVNVLAWVQSTCRGRMLAVVSLYKNDRAQVRLLKPAETPTPDGAEPQDGFAVFLLERREDGCGF
jgi:hypothetical protein